MLTITDNGLSAIRNAEEGGFLLNATRFALSEVTPVSVDISADSLSGPIVYEGAVSAIEAIGLSSVKFTFKVAVNFPTDGTKKFFREAGVYLEDGTLFAYGALDPAYDKEAGYGIKIFVVISAARLASVINLTISEQNSLAVIPHVRMIPDATASETNALIVLDEQDDVYSHGTVSSSLALKSGGAQNRWSYLGYNRIYAGLTTVIDPSSFTLDETVNGFWINNNEMVIVQVIGGKGSGQSRKMLYDKDAQLFTVFDRPFTELDADSKIEIWRNQGNQLPERTAQIPEYFMLKHSVKSITEIPGSTFDKYYEPLHLSSILVNGSYSNAALANIPPSRMLVFVDGKGLAPSAYTVGANSIQAAGTQIDVVVFVEKTPPSDIGFFLGKYESTTLADGFTTRFSTSVVPNGSDWIMVFLDGDLVHAVEYVVDATGVDLMTMPASGQKVHVVVWANFEGDELATDIFRSSQTVSSNTSSVEIAGMNVSNKQNVVVFVGGEYIQNTAFTLIDSTHIGLNQQATAGQNIDVLLLNKVERQGPTRAGRDTGPEWADPAGVDAPPNKIVPKFASFFGSGSQNTFTVPKVSSSTNLLVFLDGVWQPPAYLSYNSVLSTLILPENLPAGQPLDVIALQDYDDGGKEYIGWNQILYPTSAAPIGSVQVSANIMLDGLCVFYDGAYVHRDGWTINTTTRTLTFAQPFTSGEVELWGFSEQDKKGYRTDFVCDLSILSASNPLSRDPGREENVLFFVGGSFQLHTNFSYVPGLPGQGASVSFPVADVVSIRCGAMSLVSKLPQTRLVLRSELDNYFTKSESDARYLNADAVSRTELENNYLTKDDAAATYLTEAQGDVRYERKGQGSTYWCGLATWDGSNLRLVHGRGITAVARIAQGKWKVTVSNIEGLNLVPTGNTWQLPLVNTGSDSGPALYSIMMEVLSKTEFIMHCILMSAGGSSSSQVGKYADPQGVFINVLGDNTAITVPAMTLNKPTSVPGQNGPYQYSQFIPPASGRANAWSLTFQYSAAGGKPAVGLGSYTWSFTSDKYPEIISIDSTGKLYINGDRNTQIVITVSVTDGQTTLTDTINVNMYW